MYRPVIYRPHQLDGGITGTLYIIDTFLYPANLAN